MKLSYAILSVAVVFTFLMCIGCVESQPIKPDVYKTLTIDSKYARSEAYLNYPSYVITSDGDIFDVDNDVAWAKLKVGRTYKCGYIFRYDDGGIFANRGGRMRTGTLVYIDFESEV